MINNRPVQIILDDWRRCSARIVYPGRCLLYVMVAAALIAHGNARRPFH